MSKMLEKSQGEGSVQSTSKPTKENNQSVSNLKPKTTKAQPRKGPRKVKLSLKRKQEILPEFQKIFESGSDSALDTTNDFQCNKKSMRLGRTRSTNDSTHSKTRSVPENCAIDIGTSSDVVSDSTDSKFKTVHSTDGESKACKNTAEITVHTDSEIATTSTVESDNSVEVSISSANKPTCAGDSGKQICPNCGKTIADKDKQSHVLECLRQRFATRKAKTVESDFVRTVKTPELDLVFCHLCQKNLTHMNSIRRTQHVNKCMDVSERDKIETELVETLSSENEMLDCPMCGKHLKTKHTRSKHIKKCSVDLKVSPNALLTLLRNQAEEAQLKSCVEPAVTKTRGKKKQRKGVVKRGGRTIVEIPELLSNNPQDTHQSIARRVSAEILNSARTKHVSTPSLLPSVLSHGQESENDPLNLWNESFHKPTGDTPLRKYYVSSLIPPLTPTSVRTRSSRRLSMVPGRRRTLEPALMDVDEGDSVIAATQTAGILSDLEQQNSSVENDGDVTQGWEPSPPEDGDNNVSTSALLKNLGNMINNQSLSDVSITTKSQSKIFAHKFILFTRCPKLFRAIETSEESSYSVNLCQYSEQSVIDFVTFLYTSRVDLHKDVAFEVLNIAMQYDLSDLEDLCETFIKEHGLEFPPSNKGQEDVIETVMEGLNDSDSGNIITSNICSETEEQNDVLAESEIEEVYELISATQRQRKGASLTPCTPEQLTDAHIASSAVQRFIEASQLSQTQSKINYMSDSKILTKINHCQLDSLSQTLVDHVNASIAVNNDGDGYTDSDSEDDQCLASDSDRTDQDRDSNINSGGQMDSDNDSDVDSDINDQKENVGESNKKEDDHFTERHDRAPMRRNVLDNDSDSDFDFDNADTSLTMDSDLEEVCSMISFQQPPSFHKDNHKFGLLNSQQPQSSMQSAEKLSSNDKTEVVKKDGFVKPFAYSTPAQKASSNFPSMFHNLSKTPDLFGSPVMDLNQTSIAETPIKAQLCTTQRGDHNVSGSDTDDEIQLIETDDKDVASHADSNGGDEDDNVMPPSPTFGTPSIRGVTSRKRKCTGSPTYSSSTKRPRSSFKDGDDTTVYSMDEEIDLTQDSPPGSPHGQKTDDASSSSRNVPNSGLTAKSPSSVPSDCLQFTKLDRASEAVTLLLSPKHSAQMYESGNTAATPSGIPNDRLGGASHVEMMDDPVLGDPWEGFDEGGFDGGFQSSCGVANLSSRDDSNADVMVYNCPIDGVEKSIVVGGGVGGGGGGDGQDVVVEQDVSDAGSGILNMEQDNEHEDVCSVQQMEHGQETEMTGLDEIFQESFNEDINEANELEPSVAKTPCNPRLKKLKSSSLNVPSPFTPMPGYDAMVTPALKRACQNIGVKALPKKKMIVLLKDVYHKTHAYESDSESDASLKDNAEEDLPTGTARLNVASQLSQNDGESDDDDGSISGDSVPSSEIVEKSVLMSSDENEGISSKQTKDVDQKIFNYFKQNDDLYLQCLMYEPLPIGALRARLDGEGIRCGLQKCLDSLDKRTITYTMKDSKPAGSSRQKKRKKPSPKKTKTKKS